MPESARTSLTGVGRLLLSTALLVFVFSLPASLQWLAALLRSLS